MVALWGVALVAEAGGQQAPVSWGKLGEGLELTSLCIAGALGAESKFQERVGE